MRSTVVQSFVGALVLASGFTTEFPAQAKKTAIVSLANLSQTYNGSPRSATATTNAPGRSTFQFTYNGSPVAPTAAGSYSVACTLVNDKHQGRATGTLVIAKATAAVFLGNLSQAYAGSPRSATATSNAAGGSSFDFTYNGSPVAPTAPGSYNVVGKLVNANHQGSATGTLVIARASSTTALTLSPSQAKVGQTITLTARVTPTLNGVLPSGKVTFKDGDKPIETVILANNKGVATGTFGLKLTAGKHAFTAAYSGDANFAASTSPPAP
jgi:hypothetical protein